MEYILSIDCKQACHVILIPKKPGRETERKESGEYGIETFDDACELCFECFCLFASHGYLLAILARVVMMCNVLLLQL